MGIKERHERDREAVRRAILDAARELFVSDGYSNVSIRKVAERIEYSPAAIYSYFPSKDDIFLALAEEGFRLLAQSVRGSLKNLPALARVRRRVLCLYRFSVQHPQYFALMFVDRSVPRLCGDYERFALANGLRRELIDDVQHAIDAGVFPGAVSAVAAARILITAMMGVAVMRVSGRLGADNGDALALDVLNVAIAGLHAGAVASPGDEVPLSTETTSGMTA